MKNITIKSCLLIVVLLSFVLMSTTYKNKMEYSSIQKEINAKILYPEGSPGNRTGSPGDSYNTCTSCHASGTNFSLVPAITSTIPLTGYELGVNYTITVATTSSGASFWGFELTAEKDLNNSNVGTFSISGSTGSPKLISGGVTNSIDNSNSWSFTWTAPATDEGAITFYAAVLAGAGDGEFNDQTITTSEKILKSTLAINEENSIAFTIYPNPSREFLTIQLPNNIISGNIEIIDYLGRAINSKQITNVDNNLDISTLSQGIYAIRLKSEGKIGVQKLIKE